MYLMDKVCLSICFLFLTGCTHGHVKAKYCLATVDNYPRPVWVNCETDAFAFYFFPEEH